MSPQALRSYRQLEGHHVSVSLADGSRLDDCELVSAGRGHASTLWLHDGHDDRDPGFRHARHCLTTARYATAHVPAGFPDRAVRASRLFRRGPSVLLAQPQAARSRA